MTILETERLILRPFTEADRNAFAPICGDPEVTRGAEEISGVST